MEDIPRPAATVLMLRDSPAGPEVFMVRRHEAHAAFSGAHVFPGGRVDRNDHDMADAGRCDGLDHARRQLADLLGAEAVAYHIAALRELFEEAGVLLARDASGNFVSLRGVANHDRFKQYRGDVHAGRLTLREVVDAERLRLALDALLVFAHWVTPSIDTHRFDTRFFAARLPLNQTPAHDETETTESTWMSASGAIDAAVGGRIVLPPPTWTTLREIERLGSVEAILDWARTRHTGRREPVLVERNGSKMLIMPGDPLHPAVVEDEVVAETRFVWDGGRWRAQRAAEHDG